MSVTHSINHILFPTDFSALAGNALVTAIAMCKRQHAVLHIMHVVDSRLLVAPAQAHAPFVFVVPCLQAEGQEKLKALTQKLRKVHKINIQMHLFVGNPAEVIRDKATELNCQLIILGTHGVSGFKNWLMGNTACSLIKNNSIPVLTVPGQKTIGVFRKILFPIKAANGILEKYDFIKPVIEKNNAELFILGLSLNSQIFNTEDRQKELLQLGQSLGSNATKFKSAFHHCKQYAKKVLEVSKKEQVDLIVINSTRNHRWNYSLNGSFTRQIVNHAEMAVLSISNHSAVPIGSGALAHTDMLSYN